MITPSFFCEFVKLLITYVVNWVKIYTERKLCLSTVVDRVYKKRSAEDTITNITLGSALKNWVE